MKSDLRLAVEANDFEEAVEKVENVYELDDVIDIFAEAAEKGEEVILEWGGCAPSKHKGVDDCEYTQKGEAPVTLDDLDIDEDMLLDYIEDVLNEEKTNVSISVAASDFDEAINELMEDPDEVIESFAMSRYRTIDLSWGECRPFTYKGSDDCEWIQLGSANVDINDFDIDKQMLLKYIYKAKVNQEKSKEKK